MWLLFFLAVPGQSCNYELNGADGLNEGCNFAGRCLAHGFCYCCDVTNVNDICRGIVPGTWSGETCTVEKTYVQTTWGYLFESEEITCADDGTSSAEPDLVEQVIELTSTEYGGEILSQPCEICTTSSPCNFFKNPEPSGTFVKLGTDINTFYDLDCSYGDISDNPRECEENWDNGATGYLKILAALDDDNNYEQHMSDLRDLLVSDGGIGLNLSSTDLTSMWHRIAEFSKTSVQTSRFPTPFPTVLPTPQPTQSLGTDDTCNEYINSVEDLAFLGAGSSCRANINESWPGGRTCESPYIICLPKENTPTDDMMGNPYKNNTHRYSVSECKLECAYDQRCLGFEFVADGGSVHGECNLLDDIPIAIENPPIVFYDYNAADRSLDRNTTGADALCWAKGRYCNPYFEAEDLNEAMLKCYCPNNRKGFYTKRVQRTLNNTRYCGNDSLVEEQLKKAQANRMFHLCENWCLFDTLNPAAINWYWDPWKKCWRETYSGVGVHNSYCDRVIRNPNSIEFKFLNRRSEIFCDATTHPTFAPVQGPFNWTLAERLRSCDDACSAIGSQCAEEATATVFSTETDLISAFEEAGHSCDSHRIQMNRTSWEGWALPGLRGNLCANRLPTLSHLEKMDTDCSRKLGGNWQRLCACF